MIFFIHFRSNQLTEKIYDRKIDPFRKFLIFPYDSFFLCVCVSIKLYEENMWWTHLMTSKRMLSTLKLSGSFFILSFSTTQIRMVKMTKQQGCDNDMYSIKLLPFLFFIFSDFSS